MISRIVFRHKVTLVSVQKSGHSIQWAVSIETFWIFDAKKGFILFKYYTVCRLIEIVLFQFGIKCPAADAKYLDGL
jgi:hypothetical protein